VILADEFASLTVSIGSNDLTQLTLGLDRDSELISYLFSEQNPAVKNLIRETIHAAKRNKIGLWHQAPVTFLIRTVLVEEGIDSISFNPDVLIKGLKIFWQPKKKIRYGYKKKIMETIKFM
jgi:pyruvate,water dikinase